MLKNYTDWFALKPKLNTSKRNVLFQERDVWWCSIGTNIGDEEDGKNTLFNRPVLILKKFNKNIFIGVPLTTQIKQNPFYITIEFKGIEQSVMISQLRLWDKKRLSTRFGKLSIADFAKVKNAVKGLFD